MNLIHKIHFKLITVSFLIISSSFLPGCSNENVTNPVINTNHGVLVLYEGIGTSGSGDYAFIDVDNNIVVNDLFQDTNHTTLGLYPDGMMLYGPFLYVSSQGEYGHQGRIFRINSSSNLLLDTLTFGTNPYDFALALGCLYVTNIAGTYVSRMDLNLTMVNSDIEVGPNPAEIISAVSNIYVTKASYTTENSLAVINPVNDHVTKLYFSAPPVSAAYQYNGVYISTFTNKKLYAVDTVISPNRLIDSIPVPNPYSAIGDVVAGKFPALYVVAVDIVSYNNIGKLVYKVDLYTRTVSVLINDPAIVNIYGISYDSVKEKIYIADSMNGGGNGIVRVYNTDGTWLKNYNIGRMMPRKFAFKY